MNAILVSVDFADILSVTLPYNRHHFDRVVVVTVLGDPSIEVARSHNAEPFVTDLFYRGGADFNKWAALEAGLDWMGREGWLCIMDADVLWPKVLPEGKVWKVMWPLKGFLYTPRRRMWENTRIIPFEGQVNCSGTYIFPSECEWDRFPLHPQQREFAGYTQIFHADDPNLGPAPWHEVDWKHAGGADSAFQAKWPESCKVRPPFEVLHLGPAGVNWCGRATPYLDGTTPVDADTRAQKVRRYIRGRGVGPSRFSGEKLS